MKVEDNDLIITKKILDDIDLSGDNKNKITRWNDLIAKYPNIIDYLDIEEAEYAMISMYVNDIKVNKDRMNKLIKNPNEMGDKVNRYNETVYKKYN